MFRAKEASSDTRCTKKHALAAVTTAQLIASIIPVQIEVLLFSFAKRDFWRINSIVTENAYTSSFSRDECVLFDSVTQRILAI